MTFLLFPSASHVVTDVFDDQFFYHLFIQVHFDLIYMLLSQ